MTRHRFLRSACVLILTIVMLLAWPGPALAQVDQARAAEYFKEAVALCARDAGALWGISLCGPIVIADPATKTIATSEPPPQGARPPALGFANAAMNWGGTRWTTIVWPWIPATPQLRGRLWMHELFHRIQPQLGLLLPDRPNDHLDTLDGRYWLLLEWRALATALRANGDARLAAIRDALAFRLERRRHVAGASETERVIEINEGLAQYTGTVIAAGTPEAATADAIAQLEEAPKSATLVRTFAYPSGAAYGVLLDVYSPGWPRRIKPADDFGLLLGLAAKVAPGHAANAVTRYDRGELRAAETRRHDQQQARLAELRRKFIDGPVLVAPFASGGSFTSAGVTPIPGGGTLNPNFRLTAPWGTLEADFVLVSTDRTTLTLPAPSKTEGPTIAGDGWSITLSPGWSVQRGPRPGDFRIVKNP
jgi:hypothetical protein